MPKGLERPVTHQVKTLADGRQILTAVPEGTLKREPVERAQGSGDPASWAKAG